jgi:hypothetical protein
MLFQWKKFSAWKDAASVTRQIFATHSIQQADFSLLLLGSSFTERG